MIFTPLAERPSEIQAPDSPERRLMRAVLWCAINDYMKPESPGNHAMIRRQRIGAKHWLFDDDLGWEYSFVNVCEALSISPGHLRRLLLESGGTTEHRSHDSLRRT